ncbi:MAG: glycosyltransferase [Thermodesulfobacteriota bacterium]
MKSGFMGYLMRLFYPHVDGVIAVSKGVAEDLAVNIGMSRSSIDVVYNPVVTERLLREAAESCDHPWLKPGEPPVVLAVGRLTPQKDFITLLNAFAILRQSHKSRLLILGEGALRSALEAEIKKLDLVDFVQMPGFVDNPYPIMRASSLFVLSSAWEGLPNVLIQAMACGTPVVSTDCPSGPAEIFSPSVAAHEFEDAVKKCCQPQQAHGRVQHALLGKKTPFVIVQARQIVICRRGQGHDAPQRIAQIDQPPSVCFFADQKGQMQVGPDLDQRQEKMIYPGDGQGSVGVIDNGEQENIEV